MGKTNRGDGGRGPSSSGVTKGTTTGGATTAFPSPAGGVDEARSTHNHEDHSRPAPPLRGACTPSPVVFWLFAGLGWLDFLVVVILVTPGNDWLRQEGGGKVGWFEIGGDSSHAASNSCDAGILSDDWCNKFELFQILQVVATASISAAAVVLLVAICRPRPCRWGIAGSIFFFLYAIMQAVVVWLVVGLWRDVEDAPEEVVTETGLFSSYPIDLDYGTTLAIASYAGVGGFNEGLLLLAFAKHSGQGRLLKDAIPVPSRDHSSAPTHPRASADVGSRL